MQNFLPPRDYTANDTGKITPYLKVISAYASGFIIR